LLNAALAIAILHLIYINEKFVIYCLLQKQPFFNLLHNVHVRYKNLF
jgi:hypothetical protein